MSDHSALRAEGRPPLPAHPCLACGGGRYWLSLWGAWSCSQCERMPAGREEWELVFSVVEPDAEVGRE